MSAVRPRRLVHRGVVQATGLVIDAALVGEARARARVLARWAPGAVVERSGSKLVLRLSAPAALEAGSAEGAPLVPLGKTLSTSPLSEREKRALEPRDGEVIVVEGGEARALSSLSPEDPSRWLDVSAFQIVEARALARPAPAPLLSLPVARDDARAVLGKIPPAAPEAAKVQQAIAAAIARKQGLPAPGADPAASSPAARARAQGKAAQASPTGDPADAPSPFGPLLARTLALLALLAAGLGKAFGRPSSLPRGNGPRPAGSSGPAAGGAGQGAGLGAGQGTGLRVVVVPQGNTFGPSLLERLASRLGDLAARALVRSKMAEAIGRKQAEYLGKMMEMFERGDLDEALRHAIPLGGEGGEASPSLGLPRPRPDLSIGGEPPKGGKALLADGYYDHLKRAYEAAFERLERDGKIEQAAFVLAELLRDTQRAVTFLEKHGKHRLAAEIAEARGLPAGQVVRLWFLAGEAKRAVSLARRHGAFADAVGRLENGDPTRAESLRLLWADNLASAGDYWAACEVIWKVERARTLALAWLDRAIDQGGALGARALVRKASLAEVSFEAVRGPAMALLEDEAPDAGAARVAFHRALIAETATPALRELARPASRAALRDRASGGPGLLSPAELDKLVSYTDDAALRADLPPAVETRPAERLDHRVASADAGALTIHDIALVAGGKIALALGEQGVRIVTRDGRTVALLDQPAERLVVSPRGDRAIAVARRGEALRLGRLDLVGRRCEPWCEASLDAFAPTFDGDKWFVARRDEVFAVDALAPGLDALWRLPRVGGRASALAFQDVVGLSFAVEAADGAVDVWQHDALSLSLRKRDRALPAWLKPPHERALAVGAAGQLVAVTAASPDAEATVSVVRGSQVLEAGRVAPPSPRSPLRAPLVDDRYLVVTSGPPESRVVVMTTGTSLPFVSLHLEGASSICARLAGDTLAVADDRGRLLVVDLVWRWVLCDVRL